MALEHKELTDKILGAFCEVYNSLGSGFLEKVYENALFIALLKKGLTVERQKSITIYYDGHQIGAYFADLVIDNLVMIEVKAAEYVNPAHEARLSNYLKATEVEIGLLLNFGARSEFRRRFLTNDRKPVSAK